MRTVTKQINIYKFEELSKEIQEKLIEKEKERFVEDYCEYSLYYDMKEKANELLNKYFKNNKPTLNNVYYSLSWCQGDGAMFEFNLYYYGKHIYIKQYGHYYHKYSFIIDTYELTEKQEAQLKEKVLEMFEEFEAYGWDCVNYTPTDEDVLDYLQENEYLENGTIY